MTSVGGEKNAVADRSYDPVIAHDAKPTDHRTNNEEVLTSADGCQFFFDRIPRHAGIILWGWGLDQWRRIYNKIFK